MHQTYSHYIFSIFFASELSNLNRQQALILTWWKNNN